MSQQTGTPLRTPQEVKQVLQDKKKVTQDRTSNSQTRKNLLKKAQAQKRLKTEAVEGEPEVIPSSDEELRPDAQQSQQQTPLAETGQEHFPPYDSFS